MGDARRRDDPEELQPQVRLHALDEALAATEQDRHHVQLELVDQAGRQVLADDLRGTFGSQSATSSQLMEIPLLASGSGRVTASASTASARHRGIR